MSADKHLEPMLERTIANTGACPTTFIADAGYWSEDNAEICTEAQTDPHIATGRQKHGQPPPATKGRIPKDLDLKGRMAGTLRSKKGHEIDAKRKRSLNRCMRFAPRRLRPDQRSPGPAALPPAGPGQGERGMGAVEHHPQHPQVVPLPEGPDGIGNGMVSIPPPHRVGGIAEPIGGNGSTISSE
jgi:hypothetical protein